VEDGLRVLDEVLREVGLSLPRTPRAAQWSWLLRCAWLWLRGLRFRRREEREIPPDQLQRVTYAARPPWGWAWWIQSGALIFRPETCCWRSEPASRTDRAGPG